MVRGDYQRNEISTEIKDSLIAHLEGEEEKMHDAGVDGKRARILAAQNLDLTNPDYSQIANEWVNNYS